MSDHFAHYLNTSCDDLRSVLGCELANLKPADLAEKLQFHTRLLEACPAKEKTKHKLIQAHLNALKKLAPPAPAERGDWGGYLKPEPVSEADPAPTHLAYLTTFAFKRGQEPIVKASKDNADFTEAANSTIVAWVMWVHGRTQDEALNEAKRGFANGAGLLTETGQREGLTLPTPQTAATEVAVVPVREIPEGARSLNSPADLETLPEPPPTPEEKALAQQPETRFALANQYHELARLSMAQSCAYMILVGVELLALKKDAEHGTWEKLFASDSKGKSTNDCRFGFAIGTAKNYMRLADAARKNVPALKELCAENKPLSLMAPEQREAIVKAVSKVGDGNTYRELAEGWGLVKKPAAPVPSNNDPAEKPLSPEEIAERSAQNLFHPLSVSLFACTTEGEKQKLLALPITSDKPGDVTGLADLRDHLSSFLSLVEEALNEKTKAAREGK